MTEAIEVRRGRKDKPPADAVRVPVKTVKITAYKVRTTQGRFIEGQYAELPGDEADALIASGEAK